MKKLFYIILAFALPGSYVCNAQSFFSAQYSMGFGSGDVKDFIGSPSFRGATLEFRKFVTPNIGVGGEIGWNVFYERKSYDSYTSGQQTLTGVQYRYQNMVPINIAVDYYLKPDQRVNPFVGLGLGTLYSIRNTNMNLYTLETQSWHFGIRPELGVLLNIKPGLDIILVGKYYTGMKTSDVAAQNYFTFNIGLAFKK